jgi:hypothetical protein
MSEATTTIGAVSIVPWPPVHGRKRIMVDGVQWGTIFMESHGPRGNHYWFSQQGKGGAILDGDSDRSPGSRRTVKVESFNVDGRPGTTERAASLHDRLLAKVRSLIERGWLVHPDVIAKQQDDARKRMQAREDAERTERRERDLAKLRPLIENYLTGSKALALACAIADLIEEARSRAI